MKSIIKRLFFACFLLVIVNPLVHAEDRHESGALPKKALVVGILPRRSIVDTHRMFSPLVEYLQAELHQPVTLVASKNYQQFYQQLNKGQFDLVHMNQYHYIKAHDLLGYQVIAQNEEFGQRYLRAAIYARKDTGIHNLQDLAGKTISFGGDKRAIFSYIIPTHLLRQAGLKSGEYTEMFVQNPPNALLVAHSGITDAAGAGDRVLSIPMVENLINPTEMQVVAVSDPFAHLPWAVKEEMPAALQARIQSLLLGLKTTKQGREVLNAAVLTALNPAIDSDYDPLRGIIREVDITVE